MLAPCWSLLPSLPCCLWPVDKPVNPGATSTGRMERKHGLTPTIALGSTPSAWIKEVVAWSPAQMKSFQPLSLPSGFLTDYIKKLLLPHRGSACGGSPSAVPDFLRSCSRALSCLRWIWWIALCGYMPGRQVLKCAVVWPQNPLLWLLSIGDFIAVFQAASRLVSLPTFSEGLVHPVS